MKSCVEVISMSQMCDKQKGDQGKEEKQTRIIAQFEQLLASYAAWLGAPRKCTGMGHVEAALLTLVEAAEQQTCPTPNDHVLVAAAGVMGQLAVAWRLLESCECSDPDASRRKHEKLDWTKKDAIEKSAAWLDSQHQRGVLPKEASSPPYTGLITGVLSKL